MKPVAYIISMPHGLDRWTFREIEALSQRAIPIALFPLRYQTGPYMPMPTWKCFRFRRWQVAIQQMAGLLRWRRRYIRLLWEALRTRTLIDFMLATVFSLQMIRWDIGRIHCVFGDHKLFIGYYCKRLLELPLTVAIYGYELKANPNWQMFRRTAAVCDVVITNCDYNRALVESAVGASLRASPAVIRHYADIVPLPDTPPFRILIVGGFNERKGHDVLFSAVKALRDRGRCIEIWAAGYQGPVDIAALASRIGLSDSVRIFGAAADSVVDFLFAACDLFCLPSRTDQDGISEGLPVALIEAMAHGKPVISTSIAGIPELVKSVLVPENDVPALSEAIERYMDDPLIRARDGQRNQAIVRERYSEANLDAMQRIFAEAS